MKFADLDKLWFVHDASSQLQHGVAGVRFRASGYVDSPVLNIEIVAKSNRPPEVTRNEKIIVR